MGRITIKSRRGWEGRFCGWYGQCGGAGVVILHARYDSIYDMRFWFWAGLGGAMDWGWGARFFGRVRG